MKMTKNEAYSIVFEDLQKCDMFTGLYDAKNGSSIFMNGISTVMESIAYGVSEEAGDAFTDLFIDNMVKCEKEAQNKSTNTISRADAIEAVGEAIADGRSWYDALSALPSADVVSREDYHNLLTASNDIDRALREYQAKEENPSADAVPQLNRIDTLIIADALRYLIDDEERHELDRATAESLREQILKYGESMCKGGDDE